METEKLRQFCVIADTKSLTKAAEVLGISLGGLSKSMKNLEEELGYAVLVPAGRGIVISEKGANLYEKAKRVLEAVEDLKKPARTIETTFRIGVLEVFSVHFMGRLIKERFDAAQRLEVVEARPAELEAMVLNRQIDCGLTYVPHPQPELEILKLGRCEFRAFAKSTWQSTPYNDIPFIVPSAGLGENPLGIAESDGWPDMTVARLRHHQVRMLSTALDMARRGLGAVFMPDFVARLHNETQSADYQLIDLNVPAKAVRGRREIFLIMRLGREESPEIKKLAAGVRTLLKNDAISK